jgi:hypothetical protein
MSYFFVSLLQGVVYMMCGILAGAGLLELLPEAFRKRNLMLFLSAIASVLVGGSAPFAMTAASHDVPSVFQMNFMNTGLAVILGSCLVAWLLGLGRRVADLLARDIAKRVHDSIHNHES